MKIVVSVQWSRGPGWNRARRVVGWWYFGVKDGSEATLPAPGASPGRLRPNHHKLWIAQWNKVVASFNTEMYWILLFPVQAGQRHRDSTSLGGLMALQPRTLVCVATLSHRLVTLHSASRPFPYTVVRQGLWWSFCLAFTIFWTDWGLSGKMSSGLKWACLGPSGVRI